MGKQYISTVSAAQAHALDITGVAITNKYTITCSSDGLAKFWDNKQPENHDPNAVLIEHKINEKGVHHVAVYDNTLPGCLSPVLVVAFACFDGSTKLFWYVEDAKELHPVAGTDHLSLQTWAPAFYRDPESRGDFFLATLALGKVSVSQLEFDVTDGAVQEVKLASKPDFDPQLGAFPISVAVLANEEPLFAVGYTNGDVLLCDLTKQKILYLFHSTSLETAGGSAAIPRALAFSPGGSLLAVGRDIELAGTIALYDVIYGENVGSLLTPSHSAKLAVGGFAHEGWVMGLSFDLTGEFLALCGYDKAVRVWNIDTKEREATIQISVTDLEDTTADATADISVALDVAFIKKGVRGGAGGDLNDGLCVVSFDRGVRWYREAGGI